MVSQKVRGTNPFIYQLISCVPCSPTATTHTAKSAIHSTHFYQTYNSLCLSRTQHAVPIFFPSALIKVCWLALAHSLYLSVLTWFQPRITNSKTISDLGQERRKNKNRTHGSFFRNDKGNLTCRSKAPRQCLNRTCCFVGHCPRCLRYRYASLSYLDVFTFCKYYILIRPVIVVAWSCLLL